MAAGRPLARSVVAVALAGLVEEAPHILSGPAGRALSGPVLPLQRLLAEPWLFCQLLGPLHPPCLADLLQDGSLHRQGRGVVRHVPLQPGLRHLPSSGVLRLLHVQLEGAGDIDRHAGVLDEQVLHGAAAHAIGAGLLCSKTWGRGDKPTLVHQAGAGQGRHGAAGVGRGRWRHQAGPHRAPAGPGPPLCAGAGGTASKIDYKPSILLLLLGDKGLGLLQALWRGAVAEEETGETLEHGGKRSDGAGQE